MEDIIREIFRKHIESQQIRTHPQTGKVMILTNGIIDSSKEIAELMSRFFEWGRKIVTYNHREKYYFFSNYKFNTIPELFEYWYENIRYE